MDGLALGRRADAQRAPADDRHRAGLPRSGPVRRDARAAAGRPARRRAAAHRDPGWRATQRALGAGRHHREAVRRQRSSGTSVLGGAKAAANIINSLEAGQEGGDHGGDQQVRLRACRTHPGPDIRIRRPHRARRPQHAGAAAPGARATSCCSRSRAADERAEGEDLQEHVAARGRECSRTTWRPRARCELAEVEAAQKEILQSARKLAEAGTIALGGKGDEYV